MRTKIQKKQINLHICNFFTNFAADLFRSIVRKAFILIFFCVSTIFSVMADDVIYMTTELFRDRVFDYRNERDWAYRGDKPCVIDFYTTWCKPCKLLAPIMEELSQTYCDQVMFYKVDIGREPELAYFFRIYSIPQVLYVPMKGEPMMLNGLYPQEEIVKIIDDFLLKNNE